MNAGAPVNDDELRRSTRERRYRSRRVILVPESERSPIKPLFVSTKTSTGLVVVVVSIWPLAPTFTTATDASPPADRHRPFIEEFHLGCHAIP